MTQSILRMALTAMALVLLFAGSLNLNRASANAPAPGKCQDYCGCPGGAYLCCVIHLSDADVECGMP